LRDHAGTPWARHVLNTGVIFALTYRLVTSLPRWACYGLARFFTWLAYRLMPRVTNGLVANFRPIFPDASEAELRRLALKTYRTYAKDVVDFIRGLSLEPMEARKLFGHYVRDGKSLIDRLLAEKKGVILLSGHFGNWEIGSVMLRAYDYPLTVIAMHEASAEANTLRRDFRDRLGVDTLEVRQSMDTALQIRRRLAENRVIAMLVDRHVDRDRIAVTLFGRQAFFLRTPLLMGYFTGAPLLPCAIVRQGDNQFDVIPGDPIFVSREGPREAALAAGAQAFATQLEGLIRKYPHCWYQFYDYWESQASAALDEPPAAGTAARPVSASGATSGTGPASDPTVTSGAAPGAGSGAGSGAGPGTGSGATAR
jgi:KDO2-lipid IV(A) lauroyltransferase